SPIGHEVSSYRSSFFGESTMDLIQQLSKRSNESDPFDVSDQINATAQVGFATIQSISELEQAARTAYQQNKSQDTADVLEKFGKHANWISNVLAAGLKPFYDASSDDREDFDPAKLNRLIQLEKVVNEYRAKRNRAMVMQAEC